MKKIIPYIVFLGIISLIVTASYYTNSYKGYQYKSNKKGNNYVNKVETTEINIKSYEQELATVQSQIDNYPKEKDKCDDDIYAWWYMHNEEEFKIQQELEEPICKEDMIIFYNMYFVDLPHKDVLIERAKQLQKEIKEMKDVYK